MFFFERGEIMENETINHVLEVENTIAKIHEDAQIKIRKINYDKQEKVEQINNDLEQKVREFRLAKKEELEARLEKTKIENKESIKQISEEYEQTYYQKRDQMTDYIIKEVLNRYGSQYNEKASITF